MEFLRAIGPVFNFLLLAGALFFLTRKRIRKLFRDRKERIAEALGRAADAQDQARHTAEDIAEAQQAADAQAQCQLADAQRQAVANTAAADAETARQAEAVRRSAQQTEAQLRSDMEDRVSDAAIGRITAAAAGVLAQDAFAPARANLVDDFLAHIGEHLTTQPSDALALAETGTLTVEVEAAEPLPAADVMLLRDDLADAAAAVRISRAVDARIAQNTRMALVYSALLPLLAEQAAKLDCAFIATGHYARIEVDEGGVSHIITAVDAEADQSALLADLPQELLAKLVLPLGEFSKADAAEIAAAKAE